ncbi:WxcM-like domain-containing protein [Flavobacterium succinicans]|nr:WxcM-like domain-containing protein [Flavobacterium succinicans]
MKLQMEMTKKIPRLIEGGIHTDHRGQISFVNGMVFEDIVRFYIISNSEEHPLRAWQGHKIDNKFFYCVQGGIRVHYVKVDDWASPSKDLKVESVVLRATESNVLHIPEGYANAIESLEPGSKLISFSTLPLDRTHEDDVRFPMEMWEIEDKLKD